MLSKVKYVAIAAFAALAVAVPSAGASAPSPTPSASHGAPGYYGNYHCRRVWTGWHWVYRCWSY